MPSLTELIQHGAGSLWVFIPTAVLLGALHGLEPAHSKTMMAAFIIAIRGTVLQAALLGLSAALSHTAVVWAVAMLGIHYGQRWDSATTEPYLQLISGLLILGMGVWIALRVRLSRAMEEVPIVSDQFRYRSIPKVIEAGYHELLADYRARRLHHDQPRRRDHHHGHEHGLDLGLTAEADGYEREPAQDIRKRFANREVTTWQIMVFGITGGLIPCPASITVLLLCLQLKRISLGAALVVCFGISLVLTMVASGVIAAMSVREMSKHWMGYGDFMRRAPYVSALLVLLIGSYLAVQGWMVIH